MSSKQILGVIGAALLVPGTWLSLGAPRLTLLNAGVRIDYPAPGAVGAVAAVAGAGLLMLALKPTWARILVAIAGLVLVVDAGHILLYRLETNAGGIATRDLSGVIAIPWMQVSRVQSGPDDILIWGADDAQVRIHTTGLTPTQRASLDRLIARKVREGTAQ